MRYLWSLVGFVVVAGIVVLYNAERIKNLKIPGLPGKNIADLHPQKIIDSYRTTLSDLQRNRQALLNDGEMPQVNTPSVPTPAVPRPSRVQRYGMDLVRLSDLEVQPYMGKWIARSGPGVSLQVRLSVQPERSISSVSISMEPATRLSFGDNSTIIWKNTKTGQIIIAINENSYLHLAGTAPNLISIFYQRDRNLEIFKKLFELPLQPLG